MFLPFSGFFLQSKIFAAKVEIRRVFRGPKQLQNKIVIVENLGNPKICMANPKVKDTRIFFANSLKLDRQNFLSDDPKMPHFHLKSSLLRLTLSNLKVLWKLQNQEVTKQKKGKSVSFYKNYMEYFPTLQVFFRIVARLNFSMSLLVKTRLNLQNKTRNSTILFNV